MYMTCLQAALGSEETAMEASVELAKALAICRNLDNLGGAALTPTDVRPELFIFGRHAAVHHSLSVSPNSASALP